jgi:MoaA/NifB/PqqE/SkfB family radical SAM enzyme
MVQTQIDVIDWKLIGACNLHCLHCYGPPKTENSLPFSKLERIIDQLKMLRPSWVVLTGGEPLLVPRIGEVMRLLNSRDIQIALSTNASFFKRHQEAIERYVSSLNLALDGSTPEIHARSRQDTSTYHACFAILNHYHQHPERKPQLLRVGTVYSRATQGDLISIARILEPFAEIIGTWKIYELIEYAIQQDLRAPLIHDSKEFEQETARLLESTSFAPKIMLASAAQRDKAYFMINPKGIVVLPIEEHGVTSERPLGNMLTDDLSKIVERWGKTVAHRKYTNNHTHYMKSMRKLEV